MKYNCVYAVQVKVSVDMDAVNPEIKEMFDDGEAEESDIAEMIARHQLYEVLKNTEMIDVVQIQPEYTEEEVQ